MLKTSVDPTTKKAASKGKPAPKKGAPRAAQRRAQARVPLPPRDGASGAPKGLPRRGEEEESPRPDHIEKFE